MNPSIIHSAAISLCQENKKLTREIHYLTADPTGNITLLILDPVPAGEQAAVASELMKKEPSAEQAGFLTVPESGQYDIILRMAGGEFCGNASMSAAAYYSMLKGTSCGRITVKVSGAREPVIAAVSSCSSDPEVLPHTVSDPNTNVWHGAVEMPPARSIQTVCFPGGRVLPVVTFDGISHIILDTSTEKKSDSCTGQEMDMETAQILIKEWCRFLKADALGMMFWDREAGTLTPLVYVPAADTLFWESACGSGSAAVGSWLASQENTEVSISLKQPGGLLEITASPDGPLLLRGTVQFI